MNRYGQSITWSTLAAPHPCAGTCTEYSYRDVTTRQLDDDESGDNRALILHSQKAEVSFAAKVTQESTDFLDLSTGAGITLTGISAGTVLASRAVETWRLLQPKTIAVSATHYPDMVQASPAAAGDLSAFLPDQGSLLAFLFPAAKLIYSTAGFGHAAGVVQGLTLTQELTITEDDASPDGKIVGAASHGYLRTISLDLLSKAEPPAVKSVLALTGAPAHAGGYRIESVETRFTHLRGKMYTVNAVWIPPLAA